MKEKHYCGLPIWAAHPTRALTSSQRGKLSLESLEESKDNKQQNWEQQCSCEPPHSTISPAHRLCFISTTAQCASDTLPLSEALAKAMQTCSSAAWGRDSLSFPQTFCSPDRVGVLPARATRARPSVTPSTQTAQSTAQERWHCDCDYRRGSCGLTG